MNFSSTEALIRANISFRELQHEAVYTVEESRAVLPDAYPVKNLFLYEEKGSRSVLVVMKGDSRLDTKWLAEAVAYKKLRFAKDEMLWNVLHVKPGAVSLFSIFHEDAEEVLLVIDSRLCNQKEIGFHPEGDNTRTICISGSSICPLLDANNASYLVLDFPVDSQAQ